MYSSTKHGFSLIEAMIAVAIIGLVLTPLFTLENNVFNGVMRMAEQFHRSLFASHFMHTAQKDEPMGGSEYSIEHKENRPLSIVKYVLSPVASQSALAECKRLFRQEVTASGLERTSPKAVLVQYVFKPERPR